MLAILPGAISSVNSPRSLLPALMASASNASTATAAACSFKRSGSIVLFLLPLVLLPLVLLPPGASGFGPIEGALLPDVEKSRDDQNYEDQHLVKAEHLEIPINHHPGIQENGFNIKQNEEHAHQVELHTEAVARIARGYNAGFVGHVFEAIAHLFTQQVRSGQQPR